MASSATIRSAGRWDAIAELPGSLSANEAAWLEAHGFLGGVQERLVGHFGSAAEVYAAVEQFRSAADARTELARRYAQAQQLGTLPGSRFVPFRVPLIPQSVGYDLTAGTSGPAIAFAVGDFVYWVSSVGAPGGRGAPTRAQLIAAATAWSRRMRASGRA